jgi:hypothetical protein
MESIGGGLKTRSSGVSSASQTALHAYEELTTGRTDKVLNELKVSKSFSRTGTSLPNVSPLLVPYAPPPTAKHFYSLVFMDPLSNCISIQNRRTVYPLHQTLCQTGLREAEGAVYLYASLRDAVSTESSTLLCHDEVKLHSIGAAMFYAWTLSRDELPRRAGRKLIFPMVRLVDLQQIPKSLQSTLPRSIAPGSIDIPLEDKTLCSSSSFQGFSGWTVHPGKGGSRMSQEATSSPEATAVSYVERDMRNTTLSRKAPQEGVRAPPIGHRAQAAAEKTLALMKEVEEMEMRVLETRIDSKQSRS